MKYLTRLTLVILFIPVLIVWYCVASVVAIITLLQYPTEFVLFGTLKHRPIMATYKKESVRLLAKLIDWLEIHKLV